MTTNNDEPFENVDVSIYERKMIMKTTQIYVYQFDEEEGEEQFVPTNAGRKRLFSKELRCMMYGFGDDENPYTESVDLLEDLVIEFITEMTHRAMEIGRTGRVQVEDIIFLVRKDPRKYARVKDLLTMNEELKKARKAFDEIKYVGKCEEYFITFGIYQLINLFYRKRG